MTLPQLLSQQLQAALIQAAAALQVTLPDGFCASVSAAADRRFGDYQSNVAMVLAKPLGLNPRALAEAVIKHLDLGGMGTADLAGPGFLNFKLTPEAFGKQLRAMWNDEKLGVPQVETPRTIVVDYSAPNVAKPMHVGHIRSTILGESLARIASYLGHRVIRDNHIGDWGTQFGMIIHGWKTEKNDSALEQDPVAELLRIYKTVNAACKENPEVLETCKAELVALQGGDAENLKIWENCVALTKAGLQGIYDQLEVKFDHWLGESYYNDRLASLVDEFIAKGLARESDGAICVFSGNDLEPKQDPFLISRDGEWGDNPSIIRKADGGFLYATTDLATIEYRVEKWKADAIWYVVGAPQQLHFRQVFDAARRWGKHAECHHVAFGSILGEDRKPFKTRSGDNVQLQDVLSEAVERARAVIAEKNPDLPSEERERTAQIVGLGAVKFAELSQHRMTDYVFSWDKMLALQGDTAPYLQYSVVRIQSVFRKMEGAWQMEAEQLNVQETAELQLARELVRFGEILPVVLEDFRPNLLANYLLELARAFHSFFEACPILKAESPTRESRLALAEMTRRVLTQGLSLLGISTPERM